MKRLLLYDGDVKMAKAMAKALQQDALRITVIHDTLDAESAYYEHPFDIVLVGARHNQPKALRFIESLNISMVNTPIIVLTGTDPSSVIAHIAEKKLNVSRIFREPIALMKLIDSINELIEPSHQQTITKEQKAIDPLLAASTDERPRGSNKKIAFKFSGKTAGGLGALVFAATLVWFTQISFFKKQITNDPSDIVGQDLVASASAREMPLKDALSGNPQVRATPDMLPDPPRKVILTLHGSNTIGAKLAPELAKSYLQLKYNPRDIRMSQSDDQTQTTVEGYCKDSIRVIEIKAYGSSTGFKGLVSGACDIAMASRRVKNKEAEQLTALGDMYSISNEHILALDGIAVIVHPTNPINRLNVDKLAAIFTGQIKDWSEISEQLSGSINLYARDDNSGTFETFEKLVLHKAQLSGSCSRFNSNADLSDAVSIDPRGIGFTGLPYVNKSKAIAVAESNATAIFPTYFTVGTEDYTLSRRLYLYCAANPENPYCRDFIEFALANQGQQTVASVGFVDMTIKSYAHEADDNDRVQNAGVMSQYLDITAKARRLSVNFRFLHGETALDNRALRDVDRVVDYLKINMDKSICLIGFADSMGDYEYNRHLAMNRANVVKNELRSRGLAIRDVFSAGEEMAIADNMTEPGRQKNRRVEVWVK